MELNGVANIKMIVQAAVSQNIQHHQKISPELADQILEQLNYLERYMIAYKDVRDKFTIYDFGEALDNVIPKWHEITKAPNKYPNMKEKFNKQNPKGGNK